MENKITCVYCGNEFDSVSALYLHARVKHNITVMLLDPIRLQLIYKMMYNCGSEFDGIDKLYAAWNQAKSFMKDTV